MLRKSYLELPMIVWHIKIQILISINNNNKNNTMSILATIFKFLVSTVKTIIVKVTTTSSSTKIHIEDVSGSIINITTETKQKQ